MEESYTGFLSVLAEASHRAYNTRDRVRCLWGSRWDRRKCWASVSTIRW